MDKVHVPDHQWGKQKRKQRLKNKKRDKKQNKFNTDRRPDHSDSEYRDDLDEEYGKW